MTWALVVSGFLALVGFGLCREAIRGAFEHVQALRRRLEGVVVSHVKEQRTLVGTVDRLRATTYTVYFPIVEFTPPGQPTLRRRLGVGHKDPERHPIGSTLPLMWDPKKGELLDRSFFAVWVPPVAIFVFGLVFFALAYLAFRGLGGR